MPVVAENVKEQDRSSVKKLRKMTQR